MEFSEFIKTKENTKYLELDQALIWIKNNGSSFAKTCIKQDKFLWRGVEISEKKDCFLIKPTNRVSAWTQNYYTVIINEHPTWKKFPKRSTICSLSKDTAYNYGDKHIVFVKDKCKVGICPVDDIWFSFKNIHDTDAEGLNYYLANIFTECGSKSFNIKTLKDLKVECDLVDKNIEDIKYTGLIEELEAHTHIKYDYNKSFFDYIINIYSPDGFNSEKPNNILKYNINECWIDTECILIKEDFFYKNKQYILDKINEI